MAKAVKAVQGPDPGQGGFKIPEIGGVFAAALVAGRIVDVQTVQEMAGADDIIHRKLCAQAGENVLLPEHEAQLDPLKDADLPLKGLDCVFQGPEIGGQIQGKVNMGHLGRAGVVVVRDTDLFHAQFQGCLDLGILRRFGIAGKFCVYMTV